MRAIVCNVWGEPESLTMEDVEPPALGPGGVRIAVKGCGVNFALFSEKATEVKLCLFESAGDGAEAHRVPFVEHSLAVFRLRRADGDNGA